MIEPNAQNAEYILPAVLGNSDVLVGGRHPRTSASLAIMRRGWLDRKRYGKIIVDKEVPNSVQEQGKEMPGRSILAGCSNWFPEAMWSRRSDLNRRPAAYESQGFKPPDYL
jgi:hypothetical protein